MKAVRELGSERRETVRSSIRCERWRFEGFIPQYERTGNDMPLVFRLLRQQYRRVAKHGTDKR